ncbi:hypothetical protein D3C81_1761100 [compost metagenome]
MTMRQSIEGGPLAFALAPVTAAQQNADLLSQVEGQGAIEPLRSQPGGLVRQVTKRTGGRLLQAIKARNTDHGTDGDIRR